jgi:hypothetical protein
MTPTFKVVLEGGAFFFTQTLGRAALPRVFCWVSQDHRGVESAPAEIVEFVPRDKLQPDHFGRLIQG